MLGRRQRGGRSNELIEAVNPRAQDDLRVVVGVEELTVAALKQSGFSEKDARGPLAMTAACYAANILLAQERAAGLQLDEALGDDLLGVYGDMRTRLGLPNREPDIDLEVMMDHFGMSPPGSSE